MTEKIIFSFAFLFLLITAFFVYKHSYYKKLLKEFKIKEELKNQKLKEQKKIIEELKASIKGKLKNARKIHQRMLPDKLAEPNQYLISDYYQPAEYIGGDYYNIFKIDHESLDPFFEQYLIYFFDVSGHGIDSTLLSIFINESIENYFKLRHNPGEKLSTAELVSYIDQNYQKESFPDDYLVCLFMAVLDVKKETLSYSSGGFQFPIFKFDRKNNFEEINIGGLPISSALGALPESRPEKIMDFNKNSTLFLSTDGLFEQSDGEKPYFEQLKKLLVKNKQLPSPFLKDLICRDFYNFTGNRKAEDDITFLFIERAETEVFDFDFEKNNFSQNKTKLDEYLKQRRNLNNSLLNEIKSIINSFIDANNSKFDLKISDQEKSIIFSLKKEMDYRDLEQTLKNNPKFFSIKEDNISFDHFSRQNYKLYSERIYYSLNHSKNYLYLMLYKNYDKK